MKSSKRHDIMWRCGSIYATLVARKALIITNALTDNVYYEVAYKDLEAFSQLARDNCADCEIILHDSHSQSDVLNGSGAVEIMMCDVR